MKPNDSQVHFHFGSCTCARVVCSKPWLKRQTNAKLATQNTIKKVLKYRCLWCTPIVHLDLICMSYFSKEGLVSQFDS
jgi:hypothetical protein